VQKGKLVARGDVRPPVGVFREEVDYRRAPMSVYNLCTQRECVERVTTEVSANPLSFYMCSNWSTLGRL